MAKIERVYVIPLRSEFLKVPRYKRSKKAITALKEFLVKHMKSDNIKIGRQLNTLVWKDGIKNPPHKVKVTVIKEDDGTVKAELFGHKFEVEKKVEKKKEATKPVDKLKEKLIGKEEPKKEVKKEEPKTEAPKAEVKPTPKPAVAPKPEPKKE